MENYDWFSMRRWLARFSFSLFIVAFYLLWVGYKGLRDHTFEDWRVMIVWVGALFGFVLGLMGVRERHRPDGNDGP